MPTSRSLERLTVTPTRRNGSRAMKARPSRWRMAIPNRRTTLGSRPLRAALASPTRLLPAGRQPDAKALVVVAGDTSMRRPAGLQEMQSFDQRRFVESCEAQFVGLRSPLRVEDDIAGRVLSRAQRPHSRGPQRAARSASHGCAGRLELHRPSTAGRPRTPAAARGRRRAPYPRCGRQSATAWLSQGAAPRVRVRVVICVPSRRRSARCSAPPLGKGRDEEPGMSADGGFSNPAIQDVRTQTRTRGAELRAFHHAGRPMQGAQGTE